MFFNFYSVAVLQSTKQCSCSIVCDLISKGVSFTLSIVACRLLHYLMELEILLLKFNLGNFSSKHVTDAL